MIKISNLQKNFGKVNVLKDINLTIDKGDIYGLIGISGAGKSTLLRCINGLITYDKGELYVNDYDVGKCIKDGKIRELRKMVAMIFQHFALLDRMTVYENIALPMECWKYSSKEIDDKVKSLLELVGLSNKTNAKPRELSGGEKQRVGIARALTMEPKILLCDEATSALDPKTTKSILKLLKEINEKLGVTIILVTHEMEVVKNICNKVALLENGEIKANGLVEDIFLKETKGLSNIVGDTLEKTLLSKGVNIKIIQRKSCENDILSRISYDAKIPYSVIWSDYSKFQDTPKGFNVINIENKYREKLIIYLDSQNIEWEELINE